ncbi:MAG TPA: haloacid dehalogenase-like hydrolase [Gemmatimonadaceae bacterium]|nr:haloacid dehalogenase-like hydrolase [Gemmatimonadaceae bacterium]
MKIALFDIDGTLLWTKGAGRRAMERALKANIGTAGPADHRYDGKTDKQIVRESMSLTGFSDADVEAKMDAILASYLDELIVELGRDDHGVEVLPGVHTLLDALEPRGDVVLGLLTGNVVAGAERKLRVAGIEFARFPVGAFGSDGEHRHDLPAIARDRAAAHTGTAIPGSSCVIIGDTPSDVACGRGIGARAIAVATGHYDVASLEACNPHAVFRDLTDTDAVIRSIVDA